MIAFAIVLIVLNARQYRLVPPKPRTFLCKAFDEVEVVILHYYSTINVTILVKVQ